MKFTGRVKLILGIIFVILLVGALTLYLNKTMSSAYSSKAELAADATSIGTDYAGLIVKQNVVEGDKVTKGQVLFELQSAQLREAITDKSVSVASLPFKVNPANNDIRLTASDDGVVEKINYKTGSYAPSGSIVATVNTVGSLHVIAYFKLSPPDYARINKDSKVELVLPDNSKKNAAIFSIALVSNGESVDTVVKARLKGVDMSDFRFSVGTPVQATLTLTQDVWYQSLLTFIKRLFEPIGV